MVFTLFILESEAMNETETVQQSSNRGRAQKVVRGRRGAPRGRSSIAKGVGPEQVWSEIDLVPNIDVFTGDHGVRPDIDLNCSSEMVDFFFNFFNVDLINHIKVHTNLYARQRIAKLRSTNSLSAHSRLQSWKAVTQVDIKKFLAVIMHMSISERPSISDHWSRDPVVACGFCPGVFRRDRFLSILGNFHLADNKLCVEKGVDGHDPLFKVRPLLEALRNKFQTSYLPAEDITIDEGMCPFRGRFCYKVYMPQKPNKYGIKLYMLSEASSGYVWNVDVFHGQENSGLAIVKRLLGTLAGNGHTLYTDRFYTSIALARELESLQTGLVGTMMKNRVGIPLLIKNARLSRGEQVFTRNGNVLVQRWKDKRDVFLLSTRHTSDMITFKDRRGREKTKPAAVIDYNKKKFGVDLSDQLMSYGALDHRSVKWWRKLAFHLMVMAVTNATILYNKCFRKSVPVTHFIQKICSELVTLEDASTIDKGRAQTARLAEKHFIEKIPIPEGQNKAQKRCKVCSEKGRNSTGKAARKCTSYQCSACKIGLCVEPCFRLFHTKKCFAK